MLAELLEKQQTEQAAREAAEARCREVEAAAEEASSTVAQRGLWDLFTLLFRRFVLWLSCFFSLQAQQTSKPRWLQRESARPDTRTHDYHSSASIVLHSGPSSSAVGRVLRPLERQGPCIMDRMLG